MCLQEVAGNHGVALWGRTEEGFATDPIMVANNLIFVATRIQIRMDSYPKWCASAHVSACVVFAHHHGMRGRHSSTLKTMQLTPTQCPAWHVRAVHFMPAVLLPGHVASQARL